jgi:ferredoxin
VAGADALRRTGLACGAVGIALLRPFPANALRQALGGAKKIVLLLTPADPSEQDQLVARVRSAIDNGQAAALQSLVLETGDGVPSGLAALLGLDDEQVTKDAPTDDGARRIVLGAAPAGSWSEEFLLDAAALIGSNAKLRLHSPDSGSGLLSTLIVGTGATASLPAPSVDLLFVPEPSLLVAEPALVRGVSEGGTLVLGWGVAGPADLVRGLGDTRLKEIAAKRLRLVWVDPTLDAGAPTTGAEQRARVLGGFLVAEPAAASLAGRDDLLAIPGTAGLPLEALRAGASALREFSFADLESTHAEDEVDFRPRRTLPLMPAVPEKRDDDSWPLRLRSFHLTGSGAWSAAEPAPSLPLRPAGLSELATPEWLTRFYPFVLMPDGSTRAFSTLAAEIVEAIAAAGESVEVIRDHLPLLSAVVSRALAAHPEPPSFHELLDEACRIFASEFDLSAPAAAELEKELQRFVSRLPESAELIDLSPKTLFRFHADALLRERGARRFAFLEEVATLAVRMEELLQVEDAKSPAGRSAGVLAATLGEGAGIRIDADALSRNLPATRGSVRMSPERRQRIEGTLATLREYRSNAVSDPECILIHPGLRIDDDTLPAARVIEHPDGLEAAIGLFDGIARGAADVMRAVRVARLEQQGAYDAELHDEPLARLDWQGFTEDELLVLPAVVAVESGARLRGRSLAAFSALLRSGRPVQVLVLDSADDESTEALADYHAGPGYLAVAHREALVNQATLAHPDRLVAALRHTASSVIPSVTLVTLPAFGAPVPPWLQLAAAHFGRGVPLFRYDPAAGTSWADRFDLSENPRPELTWITPAVRYVDGAEGEHSLSEPFTFAHAAALDPAYRPHFRVIPAEAWADDQVTVADYLAAAPDERLRKLPYIWVVDAEGVLARAVLTREMIFACADRQRGWRVLQELGGEQNEYALRAAQAARDEALQRADEERAALEEAHAVAVEEARRGAAADAMERLVAVLTSDDAIAALSGSGALPAPSAPAPETPAAAEPATAPPAAATVEEPPAEVEEEEDEAVSFDDPYIDSMLCTTCNECTNLNGRLFQYNENRQAFVADPSAGTFAELVKAAEKCPARCIHPGAPREGDDTVTDDLIARAAKFN